MSKHRAQRNKHGDKPTSRTPKRVYDGSKRNRAMKKAAAHVYHGCTFDYDIEAKPSNSRQATFAPAVEAPDTKAWKNSPSRWSGNYKGKR
jgi:hypothetical protein